MQGAWVQSLLQEASTCHGSTKRMCHNYWAQAWGPTSRNYPTKEATAMRNLCTATRESVQFSSVAQSCLCDSMDCSTPGFPVHHQLPALAETQAHRVGDAIQPSHPLLSPSPPVVNLSQHQGLFQWVSSSNQVARVLEFQFQHQSFLLTAARESLCVAMKTQDSQK